MSSHIRRRFNGRTRTIDSLSCCDAAALAGLAVKPEMQRLALRLPDVGSKLRINNVAAAPRLRAVPRTPRGTHMHARFTTLLAAIVLLLGMAGAAGARTPSTASCDADNSSKHDQRHEADQGQHKDRGVHNGL